MTLYIDSNEPTSIQNKVQNEIQSRDIVLATKTTGLKTGDFVIGDTCIERKEASDLASSIKDGRLKSQSQRIAQDFQTGYIIIEDDPYNLSYSNLHPNAVTGHRSAEASKVCTSSQYPTKKAQPTPSTKYARNTELKALRPGNWRRRGPKPRTLLWRC